MAENKFKLLDEGDKVQFWTNPKGSAKGDRGNHVFATVVKVQPDGQNIVVEHTQGGKTMNIGRGTRIENVVKGSTTG
ncbi:MAG: hypothetical protein ACHQUA_01200 [Microgenomates group bacterium]